MNNKKTISIIGAGPAGLCAAINLAHAGYTVTVYERNRDVGMRFHGDFQGIENWSTSEDFLSALQKMSIRPDFLCHPYTQGRFFMKGNYGGIVNSPKPLFYLTLRGSMEGSLDISLKQQAREAGVNLLFGQRKETEEGDIIATGPKKPNVLATGVVFETDHPDTIMAYLDNDVAPWGYAYFLVREGRATLASVYFKDFKEGRNFLNQSIQKFQQTSAFSIKDPRQFTGYGNYFPARNAQHNHRLLVGEAAGFQDYLFGFGIRYALTSGYLAARSIIEEKDYNRLWKEAFGKPFFTSLSNRYLYQMFGTLAHRFMIWGTTRRDPWNFMNRLYQSPISRHMAFVPGERQLIKSMKGKVNRSRPERPVERNK
jgi:flavin-dependent dehydrogenase